jgi:dTDP-glucose pyrophosphorylase
MKPVALIPAAGRGIRLYPLTGETPKAMLEIEGKPLLQNNLEILRDQLRVKEVHIIIGKHGHKITDCFLDGSHLGLDINYIVQENQRGIGHAIGLGEEYIDGPFFVMLGDEMYLDSNHRDLLSLMSRDFNVICAFKKTTDWDAIHKNYTATLEGDSIISVTEKPHHPTTPLLGVGTYVFDPVVFDYIKKTPPSHLRNEIEITDVINAIAHSESGVYPFFLEGFYANINTLEDLNSATYEWRSSHFPEYRTSVIIPAYNEQESIAAVIRDFQGSTVDEIVVVDNASSDDTAAIARECHGRVVSEPDRGYGNALKRGFEEATGDILVATEADASFTSKDLPKILEYLKHSDMVIGTRTTRQLLEEGAMGWFPRWGNIAMGKLVEGLWWNRNPRFTDVGCTYRAIWRSAYDRVKHTLHNGGPAFSVEMMVELLNAHMSVVEIPVRYYRRSGGASKYSASKIQNVRTGLQMLQLIFKKWVSSLW